jgi:hypothetical protein
LKCLEFFDDTSHFAPILTNYSNLTTIDICFLRFREETQTAQAESLRTVLHNQNHLKHLNCDASAINFIFPENSKTSYSFQLFSLQIKCLSSSNFFESNKNFQSFLKSQNNLKDIKTGIVSWESLESFKIIFKMKSLEKLTIVHLPCEAYNGQFQMSSDSIERLEFNLECYNVFHKFRKTVQKNRKDFLVPENLREIVRQILVFLPNLKNANLIYLDEDLARFMAENLKQLKEVKGNFLSQVDSCRKILPSVAIIERYHSNC